MNNHFILLDEDYAINIKYLEQVLKYYDDDDEKNPYCLRLNVNSKTAYWGYPTKEERDKIFNELISANTEGIANEIISQI